MARTIEQVALPARWAGFLVAGDRRDLRPGEESHIRRYLAGMGACVGCGEDSRWVRDFDVFAGHYTPPGHALPPIRGEVCDYSFIAD